MEAHRHRTTAATVPSFQSERLDHLSKACQEMPENSWLPTSSCQKGWRGKRGMKVGESICLDRVVKLFPTLGREEEGGFPSPCKSLVRRASSISLESVCVSGSLGKPVDCCLVHIYKSEE